MSNPTVPLTIRVLLVEDDPHQAQLVAERLRLAEGFELSVASNLRQFWEMLPQSNADAILMDYRLPDGTGLQALEQLQSQKVNLPVLMVTGQGDEQIAVKAMQSGATDYLVKGSNYWQDLPQRIEKAVATQRLKKALQKQHEQIRYQALLLQNMRDAVIVWDTQGKITYWNHEAERMFKIPAHLVLGKPVQEIYNRLFNPSPPFPLEDKTLPGDIDRKVTLKNEERWVSSRLAPLRDVSADNRLIGYIDVIRDVTQRKKMEEHIQNTQRQLERSSHLAAIADLAAGVAHHINNPLTTIIAEAQILLNQIPPGQPGRESVLAIEEAGWRVQKAVQQLIDFSRSPSEEQQIILINESLQKAMALIGEQIKAEGIVLETNFAKNLSPIRGNPQKMMALWVNLLILARDGVVGVPNGRIQVTSSQAEMPLVTIQDNGRVIPPQDLQEIGATNFFKTLGGRGTGIEINICLEILRQHAAELSITSDYSQGTIFRVSFLSGG
ncbi:MAG: response regulator [Anaerolineales bacterium]|nr:response regulator [Anaerolineales bacterium]